MVYEVSAYRMLSLHLGATMRSAAMVLTFFMLGMTGGAWFWGKRSEGTTRLNRLLFGLYVGLGLSGLWGWSLISAVPKIYDLEIGSLASEILVHAMAVVALLPNAFFFGGILPATARVYIKDRRDLASGLGSLFVYESLGSIMGSLAAGFWLIRVLGQMNTIILGSALSLVASALFVLRSSGEVLIRDTSKKRASSAGGRQRILAAAAFGLGLVGLGLQIVWNRAMRIYLPNSTYTFAAVAAVFLSGYLSGTVFYRAVSQRIKPEGLWIAVGLLWLSIVAGILLIARVPDILLFPLAERMTSSTLRVFLPPLVVALGLSFVPTFLMGLASPLACRWYAQDSEALGQGVGRWRGANALGSALGPLLAGLVLIPALGVSKSLWFMAGLLAAVWFSLSWLVKPRGAAGMVAGTLAALSFLVAIISEPVRILPPSMHPSLQREGGAGRRDRIIYYRETAEGTVIVSEDENTGIRACYVNNSAVVGTTYDAIKVVKMLGHLPFLCGAEPKNALVIGFGIGVTAATVASHDIVERLDCVEITPGVRRAAAFFSEFNREVWKDGKVHFIDGDGRNYLQRARQTYDLISADPTHPTLGCAQLYTREYFELCRRRLSRNGYFCQYLPLHGLTPEEFRGIVATFARVFPHATLWLGHSHGVLLGVPGPLDLNFADWAKRAAAIEDKLFYKDPYALAVCLMLDEKSVKKIANSAPICTDDRNFIEYFNPRAKDQENWSRNLRMVRQHADEGQIGFDMVGDTSMLVRYQRGQAIFLDGLMMQNRRDFSGYRQRLYQAVQMVPENEELRFIWQQEDLKLKNNLKKH